MSLFSVPFQSDFQGSAPAEDFEYSGIPGLFYSDIRYFFCHNSGITHFISRHFKVFYRIIHFTILRYIGNSRGKKVVILVYHPTPPSLPPLLTCKPLEKLVNVTFSTLFTLGSKRGTIVNVAFNIFATSLHTSMHIFASYLHGANLV